MPNDSFSYMDVGRLAGNTHYRFTNELILEVLIGHVSDDLREAEIRKQFRTIAKLLPVFALTDIILRIYVDEKGFLEEVR